jgi:hypothetical protein
MDIRESAKNGAEYCQIRTNHINENHTNKSFNEVK